MTNKDHKLAYRPKRILFIPDTQCKPGNSTEHIKHAGQYAADKRPDVIVCAGDWWDCQSLSSYDKGKLNFEGRRLKADIEAGKEAMEVFFAPIKKLQEQQRRFKKSVYNPRLIFTIGNHEERIIRIPNESPEFAGFIGYELLDLDKWGWEVYEFLQLVEVDGIYFTHYLANPFTGRPYGGTTMNQLKTVGRSFVVGHKQTLDVAIRPTIDGKMQLGICCGAFYAHDEQYKGPQGHNHFKGIVMLNDVRDGFADVCFISLDYLRRRYGN